MKATANTVKHGKAAARLSRTKKAPLRASEREGIKLDVKAAAFRDLMTEQCRIAGGWATYYTGTQAELVKAGIPEYLFAAHEKPVRFRVHGQNAHVQRKGRLYEVTLHWDGNGPWYHSAEHPALSETARMIHIAIGYWMGDLLKEELPTERLIECEIAVDYRLPVSKRFRYAKHFKIQINSLCTQITHTIRNAEIMPLQTAPIAYESNEDAISQIENARQAAQSVIAKLTDRAKKGGARHG